MRRYLTVARKDGCEKGRLRKMAEAQYLELVQTERDSMASLIF
jgi:hypothetical protein